MRLRQMSVRKFTPGRFSKVCAAARDVITAILVRCEWHGDGPGSGTGRPSFTVHSLPPMTDPCKGRFEPLAPEFFPL